VSRPVWEANMAKARYVRLYADADGESPFSDEEMELRLVNFAPAPPALQCLCIHANEAVCAPFGAWWLGG
jgi:hypothetical protein